MMKLELEQQEVELIFNVLNEAAIPAKMGAYPLMLKIKEQFEQQVVLAQAVPTTDVPA